MDQAQLTRALPAAPAASVAAARPLHRDKLGFELAFEMGDYAGVVMPQERLETLGPAQFSVLDPSANRVTFAERVG